MRWFAPFALLLVACSDGLPTGADAAPVEDAAAPPPDGASDAPADVASGDAAKTPLCLGAQPGAYCGGNMVKDGDPNTLYECPGPNLAPTKATPCPMGCQINPPGTPDACKSGDTHKLPWPKGTNMQLTQDCNDACCNDHVGNDKYAWDFANGTGFQIVASRGGTVTHLKINSMTGCGSSSCVNSANFIVIDHGDGTMSTYLHLAGMSLSPNVKCGGQVAQGQPLAKAGTTGWSTGLHLHFQVSKVHANAPTCECGADGLGCAANMVPWANFWVSSTYPSLAMSFVEWPAASMCANRRMAMPPSQN